MHSLDTRHNVYLIWYFAYVVGLWLTGNFNALTNFQGGGIGGFGGGGGGFGRGGYYYGHGINLVIPKFLFLIVSLNFILFLL